MARKKRLSDEELYFELGSMDEQKKETQEKVSNKEARYIDSSLKKIKLNESQEKLFQIYKENKIIFVFGPAGTAKTFTACYCGLDSLTNDPAISKILLIKPTIEASKSLGYLPGDEKEKTDPFMYSYYDNLAKIVGPTKLGIMLNQNNTIKVENLQYMRGRTFDNAVILLDEAQNCNYKEIMLAITRLGKNSKMVIFGDTSQYDIREKDVALKKFFKLFQNLKDVGVFEFEKKDIVRSPILIEITEVYEKWRIENNLD